MTEQKLKELLADMTLEEKVNQMSQVVGAFFNKDMDITHRINPIMDKNAQLRVPKPVLHHLFQLLLFLYSRIKRLRA